MGRKYKQRGYQEDSEPAREKRRGEAGANRHQGPRGRGLGAPSESSCRCARCGAPYSAPVDEESTCAKCGADLHTCTNCRHFDTSSMNECRLDVPQRIADKAARNACEHFAAKIVKGFASEAGSKKDDPKAAFDALFDL